MSGMSRAERAQILRTKMKMSKGDKAEYKKYKSSIYEQYGVVPPGGDWDSLKTAGHVEDRIRERAPGSEAEVNQIRKSVRKMNLRQGETYHVPLARGKGYVVIGPISGGHVVKTVLGPHMKPPGIRMKKVVAAPNYKALRQFMLEAFRGPNGR